MEQQAVRIRADKLAADLVEAIGDRSLAGVCRETGIPRTTLYRMLEADGDRRLSAENYFKACSFIGAYPFDYVDAPTWRSKNPAPTTETD